VRQWLGQKGMTDPSAAAIKATLLDTAANMAPGQYETGSTQEIPFSTPNNVNGWGRVDLGFASANLPYTFWLDDHTSGLSTSQVVTYTTTLTRPLEVLTDTLPLRVLLTWTDPPASLSASKQLVNDLDLTVIGPGGEIYHGNGGGASDRINNVEGVVINKPPLGRYSIRVQAYNVPVAVQPYALAVEGPLSAGAPALQASKHASASSVKVGQTITYTYQVTNTGNVTLRGLIGVDDRLGRVSLSLTSLPPQQHASGVMAYVVQAGDLPGPLVNTVVITATNVLAPSSLTTAKATAEVQLMTNELFMPFVRK
jgi:uncharacterized repeat protein (TIGR01451 family)